MSQKQQILEHMQTIGSITPLEALKLCGCFRLSGRIKELRDKGYKIKTTMIDVGEKKRVARYSLEVEK